MPRYDRDYDAPVPNRDAEREDRHRQEDEMRRRTDYDRAYGFPKGASNPRRNYDYMYEDTYDLPRRNYGGRAIHTVRVLGFFQVNLIDVYYSSVAYLRCNGRVERANGMVVQYLKVTYL